MKAFSTRLAEEGLLLAAIRNMLAVFGDLTDRIHLVLLVLGRGLFVLVFAGPVLDLSLWLPLDKGCFIFA